MTLPLPPGALPPRKRAKTKDEKEQRRIERIMRNRQAAHASREKKRRHVEELEKKCVALTEENEKYNTKVKSLEASYKKADEESRVLRSQIQNLIKIVDAAKASNDLSLLNNLTNNFRKDASIKSSNYDQNETIDGTSPVPSLMIDSTSDSETAENAIGASQTSSTVNSPSTSPLNIMHKEEEVQDNVVINLTGEIPSFPGSESNTKDIEYVAHHPAAVMSKNDQQRRRQSLSLIVEPSFSVNNKSKTS
jgi:predicted RNase H-like nuclease (RuvC/YqgF family)